MPPWIATLAAAATSAAIAFLAAAPARRIALRAGLVSRPRKDRFGVRTVPVIGGVSWLIALAAGVAVLRAGGVAAPLGPLAGVAVLAAAGLVDDLRELPPVAKLAAQTGAALAVAAAGSSFHPLGSPVADIALQTAFLVVLANAQNLIDNMDGLSIGVGVIALGVLALTLAGLHPAEAALATVAAAAALGVLPWNFPPARLFLGDAGSQPLGLLVGALAWEGAATGAGGLGSLAVPALICGVPLFDVALVSLDRAQRRRSVFQGGQDHTSHRLVAAGLSVRTTVALLWGAATGLAALGYAARGLPASSLHVVLILAGATLALAYAFLLRHRSPGAEGDAERGAGVIARLATPLAVLIDTALLYAAHRLATNLRFEEGWAREWAEAPFVRGLPIVLAAKLTALALLGEYRTTWRWIGATDLVRLARNLFLGQAAAVLILLYLYRFETHSRALFIIDFVLSLLFLGLARGSFRLLSDALARGRSRAGLGRALIVGTGPEGEAAASLLLRLPRPPGTAGVPCRALGSAGVSIAGFLDRDPSLRGKRFAGYPVLGSPDGLLGLLEEAGATILVLADPLLGPEERRRLAETAAGRGVETVSIGLIPEGGRPAPGPAEAAEPAPPEAEPKAAPLPGG